MKLRNKKTGEIVDLVEIVRLNDVSNEFYLRLSDNEGRTFKVGFNSLTELNDKWEDYDELKEYWYIEPNGVIARIDEWDCCTDSDIEIMKSIGNYFETREQAEKVVKKLNAFKRLQDLGFRFEGVRFRNNHSYIEWKIEPKNELTDDEAGRLMEYLYEVFGGNDESNK